MLNKNINGLCVVRLILSSAIFSFTAFLSYQILFPPASSSAANTTTTQLAMDVEPIIELALNKTTVALARSGETDVLPSSAGVTATGNIDVYVSTNAVDGYELSIYTQDASTAMKHINSNVSASIPAITTSSASLPAGSWGFQYNSGNWTAVGANASNTALIANGNTTGLCDNFATNYASCYSSGKADKKTITFGANITDALPAGTYTNNVVFSAVVQASGGEN